MTKPVDRSPDRGPERGNAVTYRWMLNVAVGVIAFLGGTLLNAAQPNAPAAERIVRLETQQAALEKRLDDFLSEQRVLNRSVDRKLGDILKVVNRMATP